MNIDLARDVARTAFQSSRQLGDLLPTLKEHLNPAEYQSSSISSTRYWPTTPAWKPKLKPVLRNMGDIFEGTKLRLQR
jgi:hypothetical protein